ncbi:hypothetical protein OJ998_08845 [Solirubrobacter taibaiensis]|nr:hypothetical protein [Solirubrobacter taibaiensis]
MPRVKEYLSEPVSRGRALLVMLFLGVAGFWLLGGFRMDSREYVNCALVEGLASPDVPRDQLVPPVVIVDYSFIETRCWRTDEL